MIPHRQIDVRLIARPPVCSAFSRRAILLNALRLSQNMFCVVRGEKHFTLLPPSDVLFLYEQEYPQGRYRRKQDGRGFGVEMEDGTVPWIPVGEIGRPSGVSFAQ